MPNSRLYWNERADKYDAIPWVHDPNLLNWTVAMIAGNIGQRPITVLDIGCGTGALTYALAAEFFEASVCGADTSTVMIDGALARTAAAPLPHFMPVVDVVRHCSDTSWDLVTARSVLHHAPDWREELSAWLGLVARDGSIAIAEGVFPAPEARELFDYAMQLKEPGRHVFSAAEVAEHLLSLDLNVSTSERFTEDNSCRKWLAGGGIDARTHERILLAHLDEAERQTPAARAYRMRIVETPDGPDVLMRWRHAVIVGTRR